MTRAVSAREARLYDGYVSDWPGEIDFYRDIAQTTCSEGGSVLEIACGTGRVALRLAEMGLRVVGIDLSKPMLDEARRKAPRSARLHWAQADMRSFDLGEMFDLVIVSGHSFQHMLTPQDQMACLGCIQRHLAWSGRLVIHLDHQDVEWLGGLRADRAGVFNKVREFPHPTARRLVRVCNAWTYAPSTQTASVVMRYEEAGEEGRPPDHWEVGPIPIHCVFRFEMEHLLLRAGFEIEALYGDFFRRALQDESTEMVWVARRGQSASPP